MKASDVVAETPAEATRWRLLKDFLFKHVLVADLLLSVSQWEGKIVKLYYNQANEQEGCRELDWDQWQRLMADELPTGTLCELLGSVPFTDLAAVDEAQNAVIEQMAREIQPELEGAAPLVPEVNLTYLRGKNPVVPEQVNEAPEGFLFSLGDRCTGKQSLRNGTVMRRHNYGGYLTYEVDWDQAGTQTGVPETSLRKLAQVPRMVEAPVKPAPLGLDYSEMEQYAKYVRVIYNQHAHSILIGPGETEYTVEYKLHREMHYKYHTFPARYWHYLFVVHGAWNRQVAGLPMRSVSKAERAQRFPKLPALPEVIDQAYVIREREQAILDGLLAVRQRHQRDEPEEVLAKPQVPAAIQQVAAANAGRIIIGRPGASAIVGKPAPEKVQPHDIVVKGTTILSVVEHKTTITVMKFQKGDRVRSTKTGRVGSIYANGTTRRPPEGTITYGVKWDALMTAQGNCPQSELEAYVVTPEPKAAPDAMAAADAVVAAITAAALSAGPDANLVVVPPVANAIALAQQAKQPVALASSEVIGVRSVAGTGTTGLTGLIKASQQSKLGSCEMRALASLGKLEYVAPEAELAAGQRVQGFYYMVLPKSGQHSSPHPLLIDGILSVGDLWECVQVASEAANDENLSQAVGMAVVMNTALAWFLGRLIGAHLRYATDDEEVPNEVFVQFRDAVLGSPEPITLADLRTYVDMWAEDTGRATQDRCHLLLRLLRSCEHVHKRIDPKGLLGYRLKAIEGFSCDIATPAGYALHTSVNKAKPLFSKLETRLLGKLLELYAR